MQISTNHQNIRHNVYEGRMHLTGIDLENSFLFDSIYELLYRDVDISKAVKKFCNIDSPELYVTYDASTGSGQISDGECSCEFNLYLDPSDMHLLHSIDDMLLSPDDIFGDLAYAM